MGVGQLHNLLPHSWGWHDALCVTQNKQVLLLLLLLLQHADFPVCLHLLNACNRKAQLQAQCVVCG
jgi:hypothetical protein